ncbi:hypothetical protein CWE15_11790 [Aliidiomarina taiwanensis]|uniref:Uncharacterized protein n=1 Tax=Aliidiomarina taiwanensis TaxID=946228 RepID=A0A432WTH5_9GAMM|nr:hypothetical protein [Aliidiomarina taiwanensis]RUO37062.1 hypothetical protein CWE15_11790 [Aliidiomarina taiwanensis]
MKYKWMFVPTIWALMLTLLLAQEAKSKNELNDSEEALVSIFSLLTHPEKYVNKTIRTTGFLDPSYDLFPYELDSKLARIENGIFLPLFEQAYAREVAHCTDLYVSVVGTLVQTSPLIIADVKIIDVFDDSEQGNEGYRRCYTRP